MYQTSHTFAWPRCCLCCDSRRGKTARPSPSSCPSASFSSGASWSGIRWRRMWWARQSIPAARCWLWVQCTKLTTAGSHWLCNHRIGLSWDLLPSYYFSRCWPLHHHQISQTSTLLSSFFLTVSSLCNCVVQLKYLLNGQPKLITSKQEDLF